MNNDCTDKRVGDLLYAYELDLLDEAERAEVEVHLLECRACYVKASKFDDVSHLLRHDRDVREKVVVGDAMKAPVEDRKGRSRTPGLARRLLSGKAIPAYAMIAAVLVLLLLRPWHIKISPTHEAYAAEDRLVVLNFENLHEPNDRIGDIATNLLITDLAESQHVKVVPSQRLYDVLDDMGHEVGDEVTAEVASQAARQTRSRWALTGSVLQVEPTVVLTSQIIDVQTNTILASQKVEGISNGGIFAAIDDLSDMIEKDLAVPVDQNDGRSKPVSEITTESVKAYQSYIEGIRANDKLYFEDARIHFRQAVEIDSTFAMAYYHLALLSLGNYRTIFAEKADRFASGASRKDQFYIRSLKARVSGDIETAVAELSALVGEYADEKVAHFQIGVMEYRRNQFRKAIDNFEKALEIDSKYTTAYNMLAYTFGALGDAEGVDWALEKYVELAPNDANPYDTRGDFYWRAGKLDRASASFKKAVEIKPEFYSSHTSLAKIYLESGEYKKAAHHIGQLSRSRELFTAITGRLGYAYILVYQGKLREAIEELDNIIKAESSSQSSEIAGHIISACNYVKAQLLSEIGDCSGAWRAHDQFSDSEWVTDSLILLSSDALNAYLTANCSERLAVSANGDGSTDSTSSGFWTDRGIRMFLAGKHGDAVQSFKQANELPGYHPRLLLARALMENGQLEESIEIFSQIVSNQRHAWTFVNGVWNIKVHYYLGQAYERSNWKHRAMEQYRVFLFRWKDCDLDIEYVKDARMRLARLEGKQ